jgi:hypothetical protein
MALCIAATESLPPDAFLLMLRTIQDCWGAESSVVVNAQGVKDNLRYTITFFLNREHFNVEKGLYSTAPLKGLVPRAHMYDESKPLTGPDGSLLPRTIVLERGETVAEWVVRRGPDAHVKAEVRGPPLVPLATNTSSHI